MQRQRRHDFRGLLPALVLLLMTTDASAQVAPAKVRIVNIIPQALSGETNQDSEPNLAVNPAAPLHIAASAFTPDPMGASHAPIFVSTDGGATWDLRSVMPGAGSLGTGDITLRFGGTSNVLYAGILRGDSFLRLNILRTPDFTSTTPMTVLVDRFGVDQPFIQATTVASGTDAGKDRVYVGLNEYSLRKLAGGTGKTATVERSLDAATATPPAGFTSLRVEARDTGSGILGQNGPQIRPAVHADGTVYAIFYGWRSGSFPTSIVTDVVVVRDDSWALGATPFTALQDPGDGVAGVRVVRDVSFTWNAKLGQERLGGDLSIAVDPRNSSTVYIAWADVQPATGYTVHVRRSTDRGATWSADLLTVASGKNPALAINRQGKIGLLYQQVTGTAGGQRWETHIRRTTDGSTWDDLILATVPASAPIATFLPYIGDYVHLMAVGDNFYGIFSANNTPDEANFPTVRPVYQRNHDFAAKKLLALDNTTEVAVSIDPFFFVVEEKEPAPRYAYVGCMGSHHLAGDTGTGLYWWRHHQWLVNLDYDNADENYWYYHEREYPEYKWAFGRKPNCCGQFPVWQLPNGQANGQWVFYQWACRIIPVNADPQAAQLLRP